MEGEKSAGSLGGGGGRLGVRAGERHRSVGEGRKELVEGIRLNERWGQFGHDVSKSRPALA